MIPVERGAGAFFVLLAAGAASGVISILAFNKWADFASLHVWTNRWLAHLMELHLFSDEPRVVFKAQGQLLGANWHVLRAILHPLVIMLLPLSAVFLAADALFGSAPLQIGKPVVVTVQYARGVPLPEFSLSAPDGIEVETEPVRIPHDGQISWRVRPITAVAGDLVIRDGGRSTTKSVAAGSGWHWLSAERSTISKLLLRPFEKPLPAGNISAVSISYPPARILHAHWLVWMLVGFTAGSMVVSLLPVPRDH